MVSEGGRRGAQGAVHGTGTDLPRIALVGDVPPPYGGVSVHVEGLAARLREEGVEVELLDTKGPGSYPRFGVALASLAARGFLLHVHTSGHNEKAWLLALAGGLARIPPRRNLITLHSGILPGYLAGQRRRQLLARTALAAYGRVVVVNGGLVQALIGAGVPPGRLVELPAFSPGDVRPGEPPAELSALRRRHGALLCCALTPSPVHGARVLWAALGVLRHRRPDLGCVVFGPGSAELAAQARELGLAGVHFLGELDRARALGVLRACDALVRPTLADGDAISVREALVLGTPVVASDVVPRPEGTLLFQAGDPFSCADVVLEALARGRRTVPQPDAVPVLWELYRTLAGAAPDGRPEPPAGPGSVRRRGATVEPAKPERDA